MTKPRMIPRGTRIGYGTLACVLVGVACDSSSPAPGIDTGVPPNTNTRDAAPATPGIDTGAPPNASAYAATKSDLQAGTPQTADAFIARWQPSYLAQLPYQPSQAVNLPLIQSSTLQLNAAELDKLSQSGFSISARQAFGTFFMGYLGIYANHLPLFVSGDSVLHAVHRSYDAILKSVEQAALVPALGNLLTSMRGALPAEQSSGTWSAETLADVDEYLAVALTLAQYSGSVGPVAGGNANTIVSLTALAKSAAGMSDVTMFGESRPMDFSQFKPRGHYQGDSILEPYFRSTMWLGRTDMRMLSQDSSGAVRFDRRQFAAALLMAKLVESAKDSWALLNRTLRAFVGESDNMTAADFPLLQQVAGAESLPALLGKSDTELAQAIVAGGFGIQRIASQLLFVAPGNEGAPLDRAFLLLGQRFVIDSQVLSNVVYDRVAQRPYRMMPNPLDVAFGALGNSGAAGLLAPDLKLHPGYPQALHQARVLVDQHESGYWSESMYTGWLGALRAASPVWGTATGAPPLASTEPWTRRILQMQLASWAELRHDTILYAKQSYTGMPVCEFPDAYVEPIPALWQAIADLGNRGVVLASDLGVTDGVTQRVSSYFASLASTATMLQAMAVQQEQGLPFTAEQLVFINQAVELKLESVVCATISRPVGWYPKLFFNPDDADEQNTVVVDVHTQPADESGSIVGKVLHVGTGFPRLMVATFNTCSGPRAYAGVVAAYHETITNNFQRLTDSEWTTAIETSPPAEVPWMTDLVVH